eukprot:CAMPEP_0204331172 /NCGR_PEP_ID=MMETSP0469-20131031/15491_1 /ASSEMBLY_ACC=CAM_ASM_000384 /TAXON_ID=2969 /ORGANISM="Oxyrrhis marina" /LENGTH=250 /DNA_ID=CAMNT_0051314113 /DNA_START=13 /DNA_END=762 /DNA_ORIENTATION=-
MVLRSLSPGFGPNPSRNMSFALALGRAPAGAGAQHKVFTKTGRLCWILGVCPRLSSRLPTPLDTTNLPHPTSHSLRLGAARTTQSNYTKAENDCKAKPLFKLHYCPPQTSVVLADHSGLGNARKREVSARAVERTQAHATTTHAHGCQFTHPRTETCKTSHKVASATTTTLLILKGDRGNHNNFVPASTAAAVNQATMASGGCPGELHHADEQSTNMPTVQTGTKSMPVTQMLCVASCPSADTPSNDGKH